MNLNAHEDCLESYQGFRVKGLVGKSNGKVEGGV